MADETPNPALVVSCPWEGGCGAPAGEPCRTSYGDTVHAERRRLADLRALEHGACALCGRFMVRGSVEDALVDAWHPDPADHGCPPLPDPRTDWNGYALALQQGLAPGHPGAEHFVPVDAIEVAAAIDFNEVAMPAVPDLLGALQDSLRAEHVHGDHTDLDARIDALHGPGAAAALDAAIADGSIFADSLPSPVAVEVGVICPECDNGKHPNCDGRALHPVTDELTACACPCTDQGATT